MALKQACTYFLRGALQRKPRAFAVTLGSLAVGNMLLVVEKGKEMAENEPDANSTLRLFYKELREGRKFGPNRIETGVHTFFRENSSGNQGLSQLV